MKAGTQLAVRRMCALTGVSRAGFYRRGGGSGSASVELRDRVQRVALEWPSYGSRRITAELRRCGVLINRKRVQRLMREDNLLCFRKRKFVATTDSAHGLRVYPNLAAALVVSGVNQLWRADITYIRLLEEFVFLAVVLDAFSRRAIGWALDGTLEARKSIAASIATWPKPALASASFWRRSTTRNACTRLSAIVRPPSSNACSRRPCWWRSWRRRRYEFSEAWGNLSMR